MKSLYKILASEANHKAELNWYTTIATDIVFMESDSGQRISINNYGKRLFIGSTNLNNNLLGANRLQLTGIYLSFKFLRGL